ncbi:MAG: PDZ domain-containing protein [Gemmataceae bacterium]|nr:PDZ domain-containing protein [Gemmataceae bacterium]
MSGLTASLIGWAAFGPCLAPVPAGAAPAPDPLAKPVIGVQARDENSLYIGTVFPDLPAGKAGVRPGDLIVRVGSLNPAGFQEVIRHITAHRPGVVLELEVERAGERKVFKLKLAPAPPGYGARSQTFEPFGLPPE